MMSILLLKECLVWPLDSPMEERGASTKGGLGRETKDRSLTHGGLDPPL